MQRHPSHRPLETPLPIRPLRWARRHRCQPAAPVAALLAGVLALPASATSSGIYFAEPYSGKKVDAYQVELPISRTEQRSFAVPRDCSEALEAASTGASRWGSRVERNVWWKVERDCRYYDFLNRHPEPPVQDFVSGYDFMNAYLRDLPMGVRCQAPGDPACTPIPPGVPDLSRYLPFVDRGPEAPRLDVSPCRLDNGIFRGRVVNDQTGIHCEADPAAPGFRVLSVDYADVNGDHYLDVVLRLVPLVPGTSRTPVVLPLTRTEPDGAFKIPEAVMLPPHLQAD